MRDPEIGFMQVALEEAYRGIARGDGGPFGAVIVRRGEVVARGHNEVLKSNDPTRHAEMCAITRASRRIGSHHFDGCEIYSTTEPCVMCFAAINWARMSRIVFGTSIADVKELGFNELTVSNRKLKSLGGSGVELVPGFLKAECRKLLEDWSESPDPEIY